MKKNKMMRLASVMLVLTMLSTSVISGTFAKYTSQGKATDTATVAKWDVKIDGDTITADGVTTVTIDLFTTVNDDEDIGGVDDANVEDGKLIAPGTGGEFVLAVANDSQVKAEYTVAFNVTGAAVPLQFRVNGGAWSNTLADVTTPVQLAAGTSTNITIEWKWDFERGTGATLETNDAADTALGVAAQTVTVDATFTITQVD